MIFYMCVTFSSLFGHNLVKSAQKQTNKPFSTLDTQMVPLQVQSVRFIFQG